MLCKNHDVHHKRADDHVAVLNPWVISEEDINVLSQHEGHIVNAGGGMNHDVRLLGEHLYYDSDGGHD